MSPPKRPPIPPRGVAEKWVAQACAFIEHLETVDQNQRYLLMKMKDHIAELEAEVGMLAEGEEAAKRVIAERDKRIAELEAENKQWEARWKSMGRTGLWLREELDKAEAEIERLKAGATDCFYCGVSFIPGFDGEVYCSEECAEKDTVEPPADHHRPPVQPGESEADYLKRTGQYMPPADSLTDEEMADGVAEMYPPPTGPPEPAAAEAVKSADQGTQVSSSQSIGSERGQAGAGGLVGSVTDHLYEEPPAEGSEEGE